MTKLICVLSFVLFSMSSQAQLQGQTLIDSLDAALPGMKDDSNKVKTLSKISQLYYSLDPMKSFPYAEKGLLLAEKIQWKKGIANLHNNLGLFISDTGNYTSGNEHYEKSLALNKELDSKANQINNLNNLGRNYQFVSDYAKAATYFFQALAIAQALKSDEHIALVGTNLTNCFITQKDYTKAAQYGAMTLKHAELAQNARHMITSLMQLGNIRLLQKDTTGAITYNEKALKVCEEVNSLPDIAKVLLNMSVMYYPDYKRSIHIMQRVDSIISLINPGSETELVNSFNLADAYKSLAQQSTGTARSTYIQQATTWLAKARAIAGTGRPEMMVNFLLLQSDLEEESGDAKASLASFKKATALNDSLFSQEKKNEIAGLEGKHNLAIKDNEIAINKLMLANQRKTQWGLAAALVFFAVIGLLLYRQSRARKKTNTTLMVLNNQLDEANKVKARFFGILSHDLRGPIVKLVHYLDLQRESPDLLAGKDQEVYTREISNSAEGLLNTMEAMLLWSKEQMQQFKPDIKQIAVEDLYQFIREFFGLHHDINLQFKAAPGMKVLADENYLRTIMQNLTSNAIRALGNTPHPRIVWEAKQLANGVVQLSITDNGPGMAAEKASTLFSEAVMKNDKTGFGLHIVRDLAKAIQYNIAVDSTPGTGTTFTLSN